MPVLELSSRWESHRRQDRRRNRTRRNTPMCCGSSRRVPHP